MHVRFIGHFICLHFPLPVYCASFRVCRNAFHFSYRCVCVFLFFVAFLQSCSQKKTWNLCVVASIEHSLQEFHTAHPLQQLHNKNNNYNKNKTNQQQQQNYLCVVVRRKLCPVKMRLSDRYKSSSSSSASSASASASTTAIASYQSLSTHIEVIAAAGRLAGVNV